MTWSPFWTDVTPGPTSTTIPAPSWPKITGNRPSGSAPERGNSSVWQTPVALISTSTSPALGPSRSTSSITSRWPAAYATAARVFMARKVAPGPVPDQRRNASGTTHPLGTRDRALLGPPEHLGDNPGVMIARPGRGRTAALLLYGGVALAACIEAALALRLWHADLRVPFNCRGDSVFFAMMVKAVIDHGWYLTNPQLGAPGVLTLHDFPQADGIHLLLIKLMSLFSADWALLFNIYYLLGFPLIASSAFAVLRHFKIAPGPAFVASLLYAFLPSRLMIGELHFYLVAFYQVPLAILLALWVAGDDPPLFAPGAGAWRPAFAFRRGRSIAAIA